MATVEGKSIAEIEQEIADEFSFFDDPVEKLGYLMELAADLEPYPDKFKTEAYRVNGCTSRVWLHAELEEGAIRFQADSDAQIPKGLVALLLRAVSGHSPDEIMHAKLDFIDDIGLRDLLSPNRANGLGSMIKQIKGYAIGFESLRNQTREND